MKKLNWPVISKVVTLIYCLLALSSVTMIYLSAYFVIPWVFFLGDMLLYTWVFNPMGLIAAILGMIFTKEKKRFVLHIVFCSVVWFMATMAMASFV